MKCLSFWFGLYLLLATLVQGLQIEIVEGSQGVSVNSPVTVRWTHEPNDPPGFDFRFVIGEQDVGLARANIFISQPLNDSGAVRVTFPRPGQYVIKAVSGYGSSSTFKDDSKLTARSPQFTVIGTSNEVDVSPAPTVTLSLSSTTSSAQPTAPCSCSGNSTPSSSSPPVQPVTANGRAGIIAGIVLGSVLLVALIVALIIFFTRHRRLRGVNTSPSDPSHISPLPPPGSALPPPATTNRSATSFPDPPPSPTPSTSSSKPNGIFGLFAKLPAISTLVPKFTLKKKEPQRLSFHPEQMVRRRSRFLSIPRLIITRSSSRYSQESADPELGAGVSGWGVNAGAVGGGRVSRGPSVGGTSVGRSVSVRSDEPTQPRSPPPMSARSAMPVSIVPNGSILKVTTPRSPSVKVSTPTRNPSVKIKALPTPRVEFTNPFEPPAPASAQVVAAPSDLDTAASSSNPFETPAERREGQQQRTRPLPNPPASASVAISNPPVSAARTPPMSAGVRRLPVAPATSTTSSDEPTTPTPTSTKSAESFPIIYRSDSLPVIKPSDSPPLSAHFEKLHFVIHRELPSAPLTAVAATHPEPTATPKTAHRELPATPKPAALRELILTPKTAGHRELPPTPVTAMAPPRSAAPRIEGHHLQQQQQQRRQQEEEDKPRIRTKRQERLEARIALVKKQIRKVERAKKREGFRDGLASPSISSPSSFMSSSREGPTKTPSVIEREGFKTVVEELKKQKAWLEQQVESDWAIGRTDVLPVGYARYMTT